MTRLIFINRFFFPDHSATSQILSDLAFALAETGKEVHVVTGQQLYDAPAARLLSRELVRGVHIHRVATTTFGRSALVGRGIDYLSFYGSAYRELRALARPGDILIAKTDPPLVSIVAMRAARSRGASLINWLQDLYPEVAVELHVPFLKGPVSWGLASLRDRSLRVANVNVVLGDWMAERVLARGIPPEKVRVIANWGDDEVISPVPSMQNPLRRAWGVDDKFVVGYSGNLGRAHEFETMLNASERLKGHPNIVFLFIGGGHQVEELSRRVKERGLEDSYRFVPYQDRKLLKDSLSVPDVHWISLRPELEGLIVPSKIYGIAAAGRPIIAIMAKDGEIARLVEKHGCGAVIAPGDVIGLANTLVRLSENAADASEMGRRARAMLDAHFSRRHALARWQALLEEIDPGLIPDSSGAAEQ